MNPAALVGTLIALGGGYYWLSRRAQGAQLVPVTLPNVLELIESDAQAAFHELAQAVKPGPWQPPERAAPYLATIYAAEARHGMPHNMLARQLYQESRYRPEVIDGRVRSSAGALGIAQFMPATAAELGVDPLNPESAIDGAARYMRMLFNALGSWTAALAAYNWGIGNVQRKGMAAAPLETRNYVAEISGDVGIA